MYTFLPAITLYYEHFLKYKAWIKPGYMYLSTCTVSLSLLQDP